MKGFPKGFAWGAATAAYQIEGAAAEGGRGPSIWDGFCRIPGKTVDGESGDVACDHYHRFREDVGIMKELGLKAYRFSISWSRIFPEGRGRVNEEGVAFYGALLDELAGAGIKPMATLYHWDLPQALEDVGGWARPDIADIFADYADYAFRAFGDRVDSWITFNEPWVSAYAGHFAGRHAPGKTDFALAVKVSHNLILSHAKAIERYRAALSPGAGGIGAALNLYPIYPADPESKADAAVAAFADGYHNRWFLDPMLKGTYPEDMLAFFRARGALPEIAAADMETIAAARSDFLGINYYLRKVVRADPGAPVIGYSEVKPPLSAYTGMGWEIYPRGLYELLARIRDEYGNPRAIVTENGAAFGDERREGGLIADDDRLDFIRSHLEEARRAIADGSRLEGYYAWSLLDNFEWAFGYGKRFGLIGVDYATQERIWKKSAAWYKAAIAE